MVDWEGEGNQEVRSEARLFWRFLKDVFLFPFRLLGAAFGKVTWSRVFQPVFDIYAFFAEAKATLFLVWLCVAVFVASFFFPAEQVLLYALSYENFVRNPVVLATSTFLHASVPHLLFNIIALFVFGRVVEKYFGAVTLLGVFLSGAILGGVLTLLVNYVTGFSVPGVGASIGISAVMAVSILRDPFYWSFQSGVPLPIVLSGAIWMLGEVSTLFVRDGVSHVGHVSGVLIGFLFAVVTGGFTHRNPRIGAVLTAVILLVGFFLA